MVDFLRNLLDSYLNKSNSNSEKKKHEKLDNEGELDDGNIADKSPDLADVLDVEAAVIVLHSMINQFVMKGFKNIGRIKAKSLE
jgi:hypothetical protein